MRSVREGLELLLVAILAGVAADVISGAEACWFGLARLNRLRRTAGGKPHKSGSQRSESEQRFDDSVWIQPFALT